MKIALAGNPNSGKTTIFNELTGSRQHVGNWGGVTVEIKEGSALYKKKAIRVIDLPGTYSLSAYSNDEKVARDYIVKEKPDVLVNVIDSSNLERNLYLTLQLMEMGIKPVLALNMWDEVKNKNLKIDLDKISKLIGLSVVTTVGRTGENVEALLQKCIKESESSSKVPPERYQRFPEELLEEINKISETDVLKDNGKYPPGWLSLKLFERDEEITNYILSLEGGEDILARVNSTSERITSIMGDDPETLIAESRYGFITGIIRETVTFQKTDRREISDKIDAVLTHPLWAYPVFFLFMWLLFQATFVLGEYPMEWINMFFGGVSSLLGNILPDSILKKLLIEGIIDGVGGVASFLPNIMILYFGISIMEDTGYMARAAFIMDRIMHKMGLHGKSFIPMIMGLGCSVPAIMAARTLESRTDRIKTILLVPLISCSARLPIFVLFAGALFPKNAGNVVFLFQFILSFAAFFLMANIFKKTIFKGENHPFVMELPPYRLPTLKSVSIHMWQKAGHYIKKMGTVILVFSAILWFAGSFPKSPEIASEYDKIISTGRMQNAPESTIDSLRSQKNSRIKPNTYIGKLGKAVSPLVEPLGFDWKASVSLITGFVAKEIVVSSMGILYGADGEEADDRSLQNKVSDNFTPLQGVSFMIFVLLYTPCVVALVTEIRELGNRKFAVFAVAYQLAFAWTMSFIVYQGGRLLGF
ncbi:MAG: ferrous iron transport protein B [Fibrobacterota bacterium]